MNLLRLFEFYLMAMFVVGTVRRFGLYQSVARLALALANRYQKLLGKVKEQSSILLTWSMVVPALVTLALWFIQAMLTRVIFPHAELTTNELIGHWWFFPTVLVPTILVLALDIYFLFRVGQIDTAETEKYFSQAESWIGTWKAKVVRTATLGYVNPHAIVEAEVKKALVSGGRLIHATLWWTALQTGLRVLLGIALWTVWALADPQSPHNSAHLSGIDTIILWITLLG